MHAHPRARRGAVAFLAVFGLAGLQILGGHAADAAPVQTALVPDVSSPMPRVVGGQCYGSVPDMTACRSVNVLFKAGGWIYAGGSIDKVSDSTGKHVTTGFSNLFRFSATTHVLDTSFQPQFFRSAGVVYNAPVQSIAASPDGLSLYVVGKFTSVASGPGAPAVARKGIAKIDATTGAVDTAFNAKLCASGGSCDGYDVALVHSSLWVAGDFSKVGTANQAGLVSVDLNSGAQTTAEALPIAGRTVSTTGTKVTRIKVSPLGNQVLLTGNFTSVGGKTRDAVAIVDVNTSGATVGVDTWNSPNLAASMSGCAKNHLWVESADWAPDASYFLLVASGAGHGHPYPALCDAMTKFTNNGNASSVPAGYNHTEIDTMDNVCSVGQWAYVGGHYKSLNQEVRINGVIAKPPAGQVNATHYGLGVIDVSAAGKMLAVPNWNNTDQTGRGRGWGAILCVPGPASSGGGVYFGGDAPVVNGDASIQRLAYFPSQS